MSVGDLADLLGSAVGRTEAVGARQSRVSLVDGREAFVKSDPAAPEGFFETEARGLAWLAEAASVRTPEVLARGRDGLAVAWIETGAPSARGAEELGRALSGLHAAGADSFGAPWPGFIGPLTMDNRRSASWPEFYAERRLAPFLRKAVDTGGISRRGARTVSSVIERVADVAGPEEPPRRLHGDLWSGNLVWDRGGEAWLVDPAAHGGHRETDLAMLALFGAPHLVRILDAYMESAPLAAGWQERVGLHQLHPLLVHACLFGPPYGARAEAVASRLL